MDPSGGVMGLRLSLALGLASVSLSLACTRSGGSTTDPYGLGYPCYQNRDCASGVCLQFDVGGYCSAPCQSDAQCDNGTRCGTLPDGSRSCLRSCIPEFVVDPGYACMDGVPVACETLGQQWCSECGCPTGLRCQKGVGCRPLSEVGEPCDLDSDCRTSNCSAFAHVCRTPVGQPCAATNCDQCVHDPSGLTYCSRQCTSDSQCNSLICQTGYVIRFCRPACAGGSDSLCPGSCRFIPATAKYECDCTSCTRDDPKRDLGAVCWNDVHCRDGQCPTPSQDSCISSQPYCYGTCTKTCAADADCGAGLACATVSCAAGQTAGCGNLCLRTCDSNRRCEVGECRALSGAAGVSVAVCDPRGAMNAACVSNGDCQSLRCVSERCAPAAGVGNGSSCTQSSDCTSGSCISNFCRGAALIGDPCVVPADCAVGTCSNNVCA
jgi:hypothetical protein